MLQALFSPKGRLNRCPFFWYSILINLAFSLLLIPLVLGPMRGMADSLLKKHPNEVGTINLDAGQTITLLLNYPANLAGLIALFAAFQTAFVMLMAKRLHDLDQSGWWAPLIWGAGILSSFDHPPVLTAVGGLAAAGAGIYLLFFRGTSGDNRFGPDPLQ